MAADDNEYGVGPVYGPHTGPENWARWHSQAPAYRAAPDPPDPAAVRPAPATAPTTLAPPGTGA